MRHWRRNASLASVCLFLGILLTYLWYFPTDRLCEDVSDYDPVDRYQQCKADRLTWYYLTRPFEELPPKRAQDENGVILSEYSRGRKDIVYKDSRAPFTHSVITISLRALEAFEFYTGTKNEEYLDEFWVHIDWLRKNLQVKGDFGVWLMDWAYRKYDTPPYGWPSGLGQGVAISALLRAYQTSGEDKYLKLATLAKNAFKYPIEAGGVRFVDQRGYVWYEEYAGRPPPHILNGFIYALFGLYDYYRVTRSDDALALFEEGVRTVQDHLDQYDMGYWSRYDLRYRGYAAKYSYHHFHINQLRVLYYITQIDLFREYAEKFERYFKEPYLTWFKLNFAVDALHRRLTYKGLFSTHGLFK